MKNEDGSHNVHVAKLKLIEKAEKKCGQRLYIPKLNMNTTKCQPYYETPTMNIINYKTITLKLLKESESIRLITA